MNFVLKENVFLTGFMGAGKSTVGNLLAGLLSCPFVDLDEKIVEFENHTIAEIFAVEGESYFRDCETRVLKALAQEPATVYATGGGLVVRDENRREMRRLGQSVYLKAGWQTLEKRLRKSTGRPLVNTENDWSEVKTLWEKRQPFYNDADLVVATDELTPLQVAQKITMELFS
jgi:shikimate kinase